MIIGRGLIANAFKKYDNSNIVFFASGVSNSKEIKKEEFKREKLLLEKELMNNKDCQFVYFSTCSIYDESLVKSKYVCHKQDMEKIVMNNSTNFIICRLPQVVGKSNALTLINFLFKSIISDNKMNILSDATRNLIYVDDIAKIVHDMVLKKEFQNDIVNIATPFNVPVLDIVYLIEKILKKCAKYDLISGGSSIKIDIDKIEEYKSMFYDGYIENILKKYYEEDFDHE